MDHPTDDQAGRFTGRYVPPIPRQLAMVAVTDVVAERLVTYRLLPYGKGRTDASWDAVLDDLGWRRTGPWRPDGDGKYRCDVEPL